MRTVDDRTRASVRSISKSSGVELHRCAGARPPHGVVNRALDVKRERVAELVRLGLALALVTGADERRTDDPAGRSLVSLANSSDRAFCPIRRIAFAVSS